MSTISAGTTLTTALVQTGDTTGNLVIQTNGTTTAATFDTNQNLTLNSTGAVTIPVGTTGERPAPATGMLRYNTTSTSFEGYNGSTWSSVGGATISNDTSTATNVYPVFVSATSGSATTINTGNAKLLYKPSTGELQATAPVALNGIFVNSNTVTSNYTIASGYNGISGGPVTVDTGVNVTISSGSVWTVV